METLYIARNNWDSFIKGKAENIAIFAPFEYEGGLFYSRVSPDIKKDIIYNRARTVEPLKLFLAPFKEKVVPELQDIPEFVIMGVSACDINGLKILDSVFMEGDYKDPNYITRRGKTTIIGFDCMSPYPSCFCELVGTHPYPMDGFDLNISQIDEDGFLVDINSQKGRFFIGNDQKFFHASKEQISKREQNRHNTTEKIKEQNRDFDIEHATEKLKGAYHTELWKHLKDIENCVQCGSCTNNCPSCVCFLLEDTGTQEEIRKVKVWDSCLFPGYARMAAGVSPRPTLYDRYANRLLCKYWYLVENYGKIGCTGCGRCIAGCAGKIDKRKVLTEALRER
ncbi:MAG: 4Fe-4S dicluster domain-containing protein [Candidatus Ratteibacteria bacterium]|nr:4Fe-4S dicluster domain-containing protein [Candidatus Ratteibacteria bacterium]